MGVLKQWLPYVLSGISAGGQYALIAVGYTMVYGILRLINFAHGDIFMVAGLIMVYLSATMPLYVALPVVVVLTVALGYDAYMAAVAAIEKAQSTDGTAIRDALAGLSIDAVTGALSFDANGDAVKNTAYIKQAIDGGFQFYKVQTAA